MLNCAYCNTATGLHGVTLGLIVLSNGRTKWRESHG